jgi:hypothetical protein
MSMTTYSKWDGDTKGRGFEFAATSACDLSQIDIHDPRLKWYRYDRNQNSLTLPLNELPHRETAAGKNN